MASDDAPPRFHRFDSELNRRDLLLAAAIGTISGNAAARPSGQARAKVAIGPAAWPNNVPADFIGLSYESQQLEHPDFFSAGNTDLVAAFRRLGNHGVLRLGGNTSEYSWWREAPGDTPPSPRSARQIRGNGAPPSDMIYAITPAAIDQLDGFLRATGWSCIYGLNLGQGIPGELAREAHYVAMRLGERLQAFSIGNEPDLFFVHLRDPGSWTFETFFAEWLAAAREIQRAVPEAAFCLPEITRQEGWLSESADRLLALASPLRIAMISHHYYRGGPPTNRDLTAERLLEIEPRIGKFARVSREAAARLGVGYRMTEGNSCYFGGKPGLSDSFAAALWSADFLLWLMSMGYSGVNLHGGSGQAVATSVGGLPGDKILPDKLPRPRPFYTPIATMNGRIEPQPVYYGMRFANLFAGGRMLSVNFDATDGNATAYAALTDKGTLLAVINKDARRDLILPIPPYREVAHLTGTDFKSRQANLVIPAINDLAETTDLIVPRMSARMLLLNDA